MNSKNILNINTSFSLSEKNYVEGQHKKLAMTVAIISWSMLFATLLLGYFVYRFTQTIWPPVGFSPIPKILPNLSLLSVVLSSLSLWYSHKIYLKNNFSMFRLNIMLTIFFGLAYMVFQIMFWNELTSLKIFTSTSIFASILYAFTWIHVAHMVGALFGMGFYFIKIQNNSIVQNWENYFNNVSVFWHFLTIIWFVLYLILFVF